MKRGLDFFLNWKQKFTGFTPKPVQRHPLSPMFFFQQDIGKIANFKRNLEKNPPGLKAGANPSSACVVAGQGGAPVPGSPREADSRDAVPKSLPVTAGQASSHSKVHLAPVLLPLLGCSVQVGEDLDGNFSPLSFASGSIPKGVRKGSWASLGVQGFGQGSWEVQSRWDMRGHEPWISRSKCEKKVVGLVSKMSRDQHMHELVCMALQGSCGQGFGAGFLCQGVLFYQASTFMVNNLCHHPSWESKNELTCAPQEHYLPSFQQRKQR